METGSLFYRNLKGFQNFSEINNPLHYTSVPDDWFIIISDIKGSTKAIQQGRYKDVNTLGAATISTLQKTLETSHFPFIFGGDGATALIHQEDLEKCKISLLKLSAFATRNFDLELRIGIVSMEQAKQAGHQVEVAKFFINPQKSMAMMRGGGLSWADDKIKQEPEKYCVKATVETFEELEGLSCRWQPLQSRRGQVLTLLVMPNKQEHLSSVVDTLTEILQGDLSKACPVTTTNMQYKSLWQCLKDEWSYNTSHLGSHFVNRIISILVSIWAFKFKLPIFFDAKNYTQQISTHSDYKKFDDILRMVVDCTNEEITKVEEFLLEQYNQGHIYYGTHTSDHSIMTCLVENLNQGGHIHFIDGGDGGYAMAAKNMKNQLEDAKPSKTQKAN